ncbi:hypothetical protein BGX34_007233, partial [Mortierella sp. NVP85]
QEVSDAAGLLQAIPGLRTLKLEHDQTATRALVSIPHSQEFLASIAACEFLSSISISLELNCLVLARLVLQLPVRLLDLRMDVDVTASGSHPESCELEGLRLQ